MSEIPLSASSDPSAERVCAEIVTAVADAKNADPTDLPPLYYAINPDAIDKLFRSEFPSRACGTATVEFTFAGCDVTVDSEDHVTVAPTDSGLECDFEA